MFKGGAAFELRFGSRARSTSDVDAVFRGNLEDSVAFLEQALPSGWSGFTGTLVDKGTFDVPGVRISPRRRIAKPSYRGRHFLSLPIEVAAPEGESASNRSGRSGTALLLDELGTIDPETTKNACLVVFEHRQMHSWPTNPCPTTLAGTLAVHCRRRRLPDRRHRRRGRASPPTCRAHRRL